MKKNKTNNQLINSRLNSFIKPVFTFFVVAIPALLIWIFFSNDFGLDYFKIEIWLTFVIAIAFLVATFLLTLLFVYLKIIDINVFTFTIPVSLCFMAIYLSSPLAIWARALIIVPFIFTIIPTIIIVRKIEIKRYIKQKQMAKSEEKIIGYKKEDKD